MTHRQPSFPDGGRWKHWFSIGGICIAAVLAGLVLSPVLDHFAAPAAEPASTAAVPGKDFTYVPPAWPDNPDPRSMLIRLGIGTLMVLILTVVGLLACKRWLIAGSGSGSSGNSQLRLVESLILGHRCRVYLLQLDHCQVLAGVDASGLRTLIALPEPFSTSLGDVSSEAIEPRPPLSPPMSPKAA